MLRIISAILACTIMRLWYMHLCRGQAGAKTAEMWAHWCIQSELETVGEILSWQSVGGRACTCSRCRHGSLQGAQAVASDCSSLVALMRGVNCFSCAGVRIIGHACEGLCSQHKSQTLQTVFAPGL